MGSRHFYPAETPLSLTSCLLKYLSILTGSPLWPGFAKNCFLYPHPTGLPDPLSSVHESAGPLAEFLRLTRDFRESETGDRTQRKGGPSWSRSVCPRSSHM